MYDCGEITKMIFVRDRNYFKKEGIEKLAFVGLDGAETFFHKISSKWREDGGITIMEEDFEKLLLEKANEYYDTKLVPYIKQMQHFYCMNAYHVRYQDEDWSKITKEKYIPIIIERFRKNNNRSHNFVIINNESEMMTKQSIMKERDAYYARYANTAPTLKMGFVVLLIIMAATSIVVDRVWLWLFEIFIYLRWRASEVKKFHSGNKEKDPYYYTRPTKKDFH